MLHAVVLRSAVLSRSLFPLIKRWIAMRKAWAGFFWVVVAVVFVSDLAQAATPLNTLSSATGTANFDNGNNGQAWSWDALVNKGLTLSSNGTAAGSQQAVLYVASGGANSSSSTNSYNAEFINSHTGVNSTNYAIYAGATGGSTHNYGVYGFSEGANTADAGVWGAATSTTGVTYGVYGVNASSQGYGGYFNNSNGGYAAAFMGGNVGIGTATPQSLVHAYGGEVQVGSSGASCTAAKGGAVRFSGGTLYYCDGTSTWQAVGGGGGSGTVSSGSAGQVAYYQSTGTTVIGTSTLNIVGGNVGIGTSLPLQQLHVTSGVTADSGGAIGLGYDDATTNVKLLIAANSGHGTYAEIQSYSGAPLVLNPFGNSVGIGNTSPGYTLQVSGSVAGVGAYVNTSDARYKKNIEPLDVGLDAVMRLRPIHFEWKDEVLHPTKDKPRLFDAAMQGRQMGFIAQDIEKVLPSVVVTENNAEKIKGMKSAEIIPVLVKAIQELKADNDKLRGEFEDYKKAHP
jgi:hypothetical protein